MKTASFKMYILDNPAFAKFTKTLEEQKLGDPATPFLKAIEDLLNNEILHRRSERARKLKLPKADYYEDMSKLHDTQGLRRLRSSRMSIKRAIKRLPPGIEKRVSDKEMKQVLIEHEMMFKNELFEQDLSPEDAEEIWTEYCKARRAVDDKGMKGLLEHIGSKIDEFIGARVEPNKGRRHASPFYWKAAALAALAGFSIFIFIWCYCTSDCVWAFKMLSPELQLAAAIIYLGC